MNTRIIYFIVMALALLVLAGGCGQLRFAPDEAQKQNAWLHERTVEAAAVQARVEEASPTLQALTAQAVAQGQAISAWYGPPRQAPPAATTEDLLGGAARDLAVAAREVALQRPDPWDVADGLLELALAVAGVVGGVAGTRAVRVLTEARQKSIALREIVRNNELFKENHPDAVAEFKDAQRRQSPDTRRLVTELKE